MRKRQLDIAVWAMLVLMYLLFKWAQQEGAEMPLLHGWFTDVLCLPIVLGAVQVTIRFFRPSFSLSAFMVFVAVVYVSLVFEVFLPRFSESYTADYFDVVCYSLGAILFMVYRVATTKARLSAYLSWPKTHQAG